MNATQLLCRTIERRLDSIFMVARTLPADRLDWKPTPASRSALDQLQEVATAPDQFASAHLEHKIEWNNEKFAQWMEERSKLTTIDELEAHSKAAHEKLFEHIRGLSEEQLDEPVQMPFPGEWRVGDILSYYIYNTSYHEGQITYIAGLIEGGL